MGDPIYEFVKRDHWSGILVEPVKYLFDELLSNYKSCNNLVFENVAIANENGMKDFCYVKNAEKLPSWIKGTGSFNIETWNARLDLKEYMVIEKVPCITLDALLKKHDIKKVDLLLIDTEGYDYEIIKQIDFQKIKPKLLIYESVNLSVNDYNQCIRYLRKNGYTLHREGYNILAEAE